MNILQVFWKTAWRSALVALGYVGGLMLAGMIGAMLGRIPAGAGAASNLLPLLVASLLLGVFLGPFAARLALTRSSYILGIKINDQRI